MAEPGRWRSVPQTFVSPPTPPGCLREAVRAADPFLFRFHQLGSVVLPVCVPHPVHVPNPHHRSGFSRVLTSLHLPPSSLEMCSISASVTESHQPSIAGTLTCRSMNLCNGAAGALVRSTEDDLPGLVFPARKPLSKCRLQL